METPLTAGLLYDFLTRWFEKYPTTRDSVVAVEVREEDEDEPEYGGDTNFIAPVFHLPDRESEDLPELGRTSILKFFVIEPDPLKQFAENLQMLRDRGHGEMVDAMLDEAGIVVTPPEKEEE